MSRYFVRPLSLTPSLPTEDLQKCDFQAFAWRTSKSFLILQALFSFSFLLKQCELARGIEAKKLQGRKTGGGGAGGGNPLNVCVHVYRGRVCVCVLCCVVLCCVLLCCVVLCCVCVCVFFFWFLKVRPSNDICSHGS